jgi:hypothetical protein
MARALYAAVVLVVSLAWAYALNVVLLANTWDWWSEPVGLVLTAGFTILSVVGAYFFSEI